MNRRHTFWWAALGALGPLLLMAAPAPAADATIAAAISLRDVLHDAKPMLEKAAGEKVQFTLGASGTLRLQLERGMAVDVYISADRQNPQRLIAEGQADAKTAAVIATNQLVLIAPTDNPAHIEKLADLIGPRVRHVAIGTPAAVPAGQYAKRTLEHAQLFAPLQKTDRLVFGENVAQVLTLVARGEVDAGLVYASDAQAAGPKVKVIEKMAADTHDPIEYELVIPKEAQNAATAGKIAAALQTPAFHKILTKHGFSPPERAQDK